VIRLRGSEDSFVAHRRNQKAPCKILQMQGAFSSFLESTSHHCYQAISGVITGLFQPIAVRW